MEKFKAQTIIGTQIYMTKTIHLFRGMENNLIELLAPKTR